MHAYTVTTALVPCCSATAKILKSASLKSPEYWSKLTCLLSCLKMSKCKSLQLSLNSLIIRLFAGQSKDFIPTQSVTICGLGSIQFKRAIEAIETIHRYLLSKYSELLPWKPDAFDTWSALSFDNKLVTPRSSVTKGAPTLSYRHIDPKRIMATALGSRGVYTADNVVQYQAVEEE